MAKVKKKKNIELGGWFVAFGCLIRTIQIIGAFFGAGFISNRWLYIAMLCGMCGGFALLGYEKRGKASLTAIISAAVCLLSTVMGNMSDGGDALRVFSAIFLVLSFAVSGVHCVIAANGRTVKAISGAGLVIIAALLGAFAFGVSVAPVVMLLILIVAYALMGVAVIL